jgi:peptidyl-prolyl cis-trans isomerase SurA
MIAASAMSPGRRLAMAAFALGVLAGGPAGGEVVDRIVATIDGDPITSREVQRFAKERDAEQVPEARVLDALITDKLLDKEIKNANIVARDDDIDRYIKEIKARNGIDDERFQKALDAQGLTMAAYRARVKGEIEKSQLVNREIRARVNVSPQEIERYYKAHLDDYAISERIKVRDIFFAVDTDADEATVERTRAKAAEVRKMALDGKDFGALAKQFSEGPGADKGGEIGTFARGEMDPALEEVAFSLKRREVSEPVKTMAGFHLLRVESEEGASHKPLDQVRDEIRDALYNEALESRYQDWLSRDLRERHHVEVLD